MKRLLLVAAVLGAVLIAPASASADPGYYCKASAFRATVLGSFQEPVRSNVPFRPCEDDVDSLASLPANPAVSATVLETYTNDFPRRPTPTSVTPDPINPANPKTRGGVARAKLASAGLVAPGGTFTLGAKGLKAQVDTTCAGGPPIRPTNRGSGGVAELTINGVPQTILGTPNQVITIPQVGTLTVNYQVQTGSGFSASSPKIMTRRALYLDIVTSQPVSHPIGHALGPILGSNVVIGEAVAGFEGVQSPCGIPIPPGA